MIIYNGKGLVVTLLVAGLFIACVMMELGLGLSFMLPGVAGLFATIKLSEKGGGYSGLPSVFFIPTHVYTVIISLLGFMFFYTDPVLFDPQTEDARFEMLEKDIAVMDSLQISGIDSAAIKLQTYVNGVLIRQLKPQEFSYRLLENEAQNKVLVLMEFKQLDRLENEAKEEFMYNIEDYFYSDTNYYDKEVFIGITSGGFIDMTLGREGIKINYQAVSSSLIPFYSDSVLTREGE